MKPRWIKNVIIDNNLILFTSFNFIFPVLWIDNFSTYFISKIYKVTKMFYAISLVYFIFDDLLYIFFYICLIAFYVYHMTSRLGVK